MGPTWPSDNVEPRRIANGHPRTGFGSLPSIRRHFVLSLRDNTFTWHQTVFQDNTKDVIHRNLAMKSVDGKVWKTNLLEVLASLVGFTSMSAWEDAAEFGVTPPILVLTWETSLTFWLPHGQSHSLLGIPLADDLVCAVGGQEYLLFNEEI